MSNNNDVYIKFGEHINLANILTTELIKQTFNVAHSVDDDELILNKAGFSIASKNLAQFISKILQENLELKERSTIMTPINNVDCNKSFLA